MNSNKLREKKKLMIIYAHSNGKEFLFDTTTDDNSERQHFLPPVHLDPGWESTDRAADELDFRTLEGVEELERHQPHDRFYAVYIIIVIHGIGILTPWNTFINTKAVSRQGTDREDKARKLY